MISHDTPNYPPTDFIEEVAPDMHPDGIDVLRNVYLAQYLGQGSISMTRNIAELTGPLQITEWTEAQRTSYPEVSQEVSHFFAADGARELADASLAYATGPEGQAPKDVRTELLKQGWDAFRDIMPEHVSTLHMMAEYADSPRNFSIDPISTFLRIKKAANRTQHHIGVAKQLVQLDTDALNLGRRSTEVTPCTDSVVRESALALRPTGSAALDTYVLPRIHDVIAGNMIGKPMAGLQQAWMKRNPEGSFLPESYRRESETRSLDDRSELFLRRILAAAFPPYGAQLESR